MLFDRFHPFAIFLFAASLLVGLSACGDLPKPFAHEGPVHSNPLLKSVRTDSVRIEMGASIPSSIADPMSKSALNAFKQANIPASRTLDFVPSYIIKGGMKIYQDDASAPETAEFNWRLLDGTGTALKSFNLKITGDQTGWLFFDKQLIGEIGRSLGMEIANHIEGRKIQIRKKLEIPDDQFARNNQPEKLIPRFFIAEVVGAPGDGALSLYRALRRLLKKSGGEISYERPAATHLVKGFVNVSEEFHGTNDIAITWLVTAPKGQELGKVTQINRVPAGRLNRRWGDIAFAIAQGASNGIMDIAERHNRKRTQKNGLKIPYN